MTIRAYKRPTDHPASSKHPMEKHEEFTKWAKARGVKLYGIKCHKIEGKGMGIVADRMIEDGHVILTVPTSALRTIHTIPPSITTLLPTATVHSLLATQLSLETSPTLQPWLAVLPTMTDFASMPILQNVSGRATLSSRANKFLTSQELKYRKDWLQVHASFPNLPEETYKHNWLIVNTRTFHYVRPGSPRPQSNDDCMALNPFADYFNHAERGCTVSYDRKGYTFYANRRFEEGEEIFISYGNHSNDFLLVEYGFQLEGNKIL